MSYLKMWQCIWFVATVVSCVDINLIDNVVRVTTSVPNITAIGTQNDYSRDDQGEVVTDYNVETEHGTVVGYKNGTIMQFFDIPYGYFSAENPFQEPTAPAAWEIPREITEHTSKCPQMDSANVYVGSHECLTLSIFKPENAENADVLFHIHDSSFNTGSGDPLEYGPKYLVSQGIILVLPNYRLGPLGFLCLENGTVPGNAGLMDLTLALQWTVNNINAFGGNNANIVISGSGAGGALVEYLLLSNTSRALVSKAITESGFILSPWAIDRYPLETARLLAENVNSDIRIVRDYSIRPDNTNVFNSIVQSDLEKIIRAGQNIAFRPCINNETGFLTETPWHILNNEKLNISIMSGSANQAAMEKALQQTEETLSQINQDFTLLLPDDLKFDNDEEKTRIGMEVKIQYFSENNITINNMEQLSQCYSDSKYIFPGIRGARLLVKGGATVYFYEFSYDGRNSINGSARGDSLSFVFSKYDDDETAEEIHTKVVMRDLWVNFIKYGKPSAENIEWSSLEATAVNDEAWLSIGNEVRMEKGFHRNRLQLWEDIYGEHFVENNLASKQNCSIYIALLAPLLLLDIRNNFKI